MPALAVQIADHPPVVALLGIRNVQRGDFGAAQTASGEYGNDGSVSFASDRIQIWRAQKRLDLIGTQPVAKPNSHPLRAFYATDAGRQFWAEKAGVGGLVASRRTAERRRLILDADNRRDSNSSRYRSTTVLLKARRGSEQYQAANCRMAWS